MILRTNCECLCQVLILLLVLPGLAIGGESRDMCAAETKLDVVTVTAQKRLVGDRLSSPCVDSWFTQRFYGEHLAGPTQSRAVTLTWETR